MSLLIDALRKHRQESTPLLLQPESSHNESGNIQSGKFKKILIVSFVLVIVIVLTAMGSFLLFKHMEKKHITQAVHGKMAELQQVKAKLAERSGEAPSQSLSKSPAAGELRSRLEQRMQQENQPQTSVAPSAAATDNTASPDAAATNTVSTTTATTSAAQSDSASGRGTLRDRIAARKTEDESTNSSSVAAASNPPATSTDDASDDASDSTSDDSSNENSADAGVKKVNIQAVPDQVGANNPTYQKALSFMQADQYDKALELVQNNDELLFKTQGLSGLLLARIYLTIEKYDLADEAVEHAMMLHAGSAIELLSLKAQALFMQKRYQEAIELLSSQSPDLSTFPEYYALLADAYMHVDQASNAVSIFQQIVARFPNSAEYWLGLAVACQKSGEASSAVVAYRRAAQLSQEDPQVSLFINQQLSVLQAT